MTDITLRWAGPSDAGSGSTYKIERSLNGSTWSTLAASQAATSPYVSPGSTLASQASYGDTSILLASGTAFSSAGYGWVDDALIEWTGKSVNQLTGVIWHTGYGTYASGTTLVEAHESYADTGVTITNNAAIYRITQTDSSGNDSPPLYVWYHMPPVPSTRDHCVVVVALATDLGFVLLDEITVNCVLNDVDQFSTRAGLHLRANGGSNAQVTNALGLAFFQCWRDSARSDIAGGDDALYSFTINPSGDAIVISAESIPDRDWVLLHQIA